MHCVLRDKLSRVAKNPVKLPAGVEVKSAGQQLSVKVPRAILELNIHSSVEIVEEAGELRFIARNGDQQTAQWPVPRVRW